MYQYKSTTNEFYMKYDVSGSGGSDNKEDSSKSGHPNDKTSTEIQTKVFLDTAGISQRIRLTLRTAR